MAANISYANIARKAAGTSEDNDTTGEIIEVPTLATPVSLDPEKENATKKSNSSKKKSRSRKDRKEKKAAKLALAEAEKAKISESSEAEEPAKVFIPAPPPKVNVWHKNKSTEVTEEEEAETETKAEKGQEIKQEPTPADAAVMKESTADNRQAAKKPLVSSTLGSPWKTPQANSAQVCYLNCIIFCEIIQKLHFEHLNLYY